MFPWGFALKGAAIAAVLLSVFLGYKWFTGVLEENKTLSVRVGKAEAQVTQERNAHLKTKQEYAKWRSDVTAQIEQEQVNRDALQAQYDKARKQTDVLSKKLAKHDLEFLASRKPRLIEHRVNRATVRVLSDIEQLTGGFASGGVEAAAPP